MPNLYSIIVWSNPLFGKLTPKPLGNNKRIILLTIIATHDKKIFYPIVIKFLTYELTIYKYFLYPIFQQIHLIAKEI